MASPKRPIPAPSTTSEWWTPAHTEGLKGLGRGLLQDYQNVMDPVANAGERVAEHPATQLAALMLMARPGLGKPGKRWAETIERLGSKIPVSSGIWNRKGAPQSQDLFEVAQQNARMYPATMSQVRGIRSVRPRVVDNYGGQVPTEGMLSNQPEILINDREVAAGPEVINRIMQHELQHIAQNYWRARGVPSTLSTLVSARSNEDVPSYYERPWEISALLRPLKAAFTFPHSEPGMPDWMKQVATAYFNMSPAMQEDIIRNPQKYPQYGRAVSAWLQGSYPKYYQTYTADPHSMEYLMGEGPEAAGVFSKGAR